MEVCIAYSHIFIPSIHGVDGLGKLWAASLVDTASVDPQPLVPILLHLLAALDDLSIAITLANFSSLLLIHLCELDRLIKIHFLLDPPMG